MSKPAKMLPCSDKVPTNPLLRTKHSASSSYVQPKEPIVKRSRLGGKKVRTGCITCKIRRIKCDENKPSCNKCTSTGRKCDGYAVPLDRVESNTALSNPSPERSLVVTPGTTEDLRFMDFFYSKTAPALSSFFDAEFWSQLVLQLSRIEPSVRHAMLAVGALHRQREELLSIPNCPVDETKAEDPVVLKHYNAAIRSLRQHINEHPLSVDVALVGCILFVALEFLRGDRETAITHVQSGIAIIRQPRWKTKSQLSQPSIQLVEDKLVPFFDRLNLTAALEGRDSGHQYAVPWSYVVPDSFASLYEARDALTHLMNLSIRFISTTLQTRGAGSFSTEQLAAQHRFKTQMERWAAIFERYLNALTSSGSSYTTPAIPVLLIQHKLTYIWLCICIISSEKATDSYIPDFEEVVNLAEIVLNSNRAPASFTFHIEIVPQLFFIAAKCRHRRIRRRAIQLLGSVVRREGLWDSRMAAAVATHVMEIEEAGLDPNDHDALPSEEARTHSTVINSDSGINPDRHHVSILTKPAGLDKEWHTWRGYVYVQGPRSSGAMDRS